MIGLIANSALLVSLAVVLLGAVIIPVAIRNGRRDWIELSYGAVTANFVLVSLATLSMIIALLRHDFSISYVAQVGSRATPIPYTIASLWSSLEGSILFWAWVLSMYSFAIILSNRKREGDLVPYAAMTLMVIAAFFAILIVGPANPFRPVFPVPADGPGPNTLLQNNILMVIHPPLLYLGYVGMSVPFAFAIGAILSNDTLNWSHISRRWMLASWAFLSAAIIAGMWWSYEVLGWGGYWAWDPVENASFMPWLTATAYMHSVMVQERRNMLRLWTLNLCVATFVLTILGTFLTRSGIISSVHSFTAGSIGYYFLGFIAFVLISTVVLIAGQAHKLKANGKLEGVTSRETIFLFNNLFLTTVMLTVLVGTLYPLIAEAIRNVKVSVGEPFYNRMAVPAMLALIFLMGVGPALPWGATKPEELKSRLLPPLAGAVILGAIGAIAGARGIYSLLAFACVGYAIVANLREYVIAASARVRAHGETWGVALWRILDANPRRYGGYIAHIGILLSALGIVASSSFRSEQEKTLNIGETLTVAGQTVRLRNVWQREEPQRWVIGVTLDIEGPNETVKGTMEPRMNYYRSSAQPVVTPAVRSSVRGDLYANLMEFDSLGRYATVKIISEPLIPWIWFGGLVVVIGAVVAATQKLRAPRLAGVAEVAEVSA